MNYFVFLEDIESACSPDILNILVSEQKCPTMIVYQCYQELPSM